jgi:hypothetical protein
MISVVLALVFTHFPVALPISAIDCNFCPGDGHALDGSRGSARRKNQRRQSPRKPQDLQTISSPHRGFLGGDVSFLFSKAIDGRHIEASINGGTPIISWLAYFMEHPTKMDDLGDIAVYFGI